MDGSLDRQFFWKVCVILLCRPGNHSCQTKLFRLSSFMYKNSIVVNEDKVTDQAVPLLMLKLITMSHYPLLFRAAGNYSNLPLRNKQRSHLKSVALTS